MNNDIQTEVAPNSRRQRSAKRLRYEAQAKVFERQVGSLEEIRRQLGLRPAQLCEILKVHPSAWTRWTRTGRTPPHIYQMLDWYLEILNLRGQKQGIGLHDARPQTLGHDSTPHRPHPPHRRGVTRFLISMWFLQTLIAGAIILVLLRKS